MDTTFTECEPVIAKLNEHCLSLHALESRYEPVEQAYVSMLEFLQEQANCRPRLEAELQAMVAEFRYARQRQPRLSIDAIAFCMHSLRWPGVLLAAQREHQDFFVPRCDDFMWRLMDAYSPGWNERGEYAYYTRRERGGADA